MKRLNDNEMGALQLIRSTRNSPPNAIMPAGHVLINANVPALLRGGYIKYGRGRIAYELTALGYHVLDEKPI